MSAKRVRTAQQSGPMIDRSSDSEVLVSALTYARIRLIADVRDLRAQRRALSLAAILEHYSDRLLGLIDALAMIDRPD